MYKKTIIILVLACCMAMQGWSQGLADSLGAAFKNLPDTAKISYLIRESWGMLYTTPAKALQYMDFGLQMAQEQEIDYRYADLKLQRGTVLWALGDFDAALVQMKDAKREYEAAQDSLGMAKADNNIGLVFFDQSYLDLSLEAHLSALTYFEAHPDKRRLPVIYNNIGNIYNRLNQYDQAEPYYRKALQLLEQGTDTNSIAMVSNNLGLVIENLGRHQEAKQHYQTAIDGYKAIGNLNGWGNVLTNMSDLLLKEERWVEAEAMYMDALKLSIQVGNQYDIAIANLKLAEYYVKTKQYTRAIPFGQQALDLGQAPGGMSQLASAHEALSAAHEGTGAYNLALEHYKEFKRYNDSIFNDAKSRAIAELNLKYDTALKDQEIERLNQNRRLSELRTIILIVVLVLVFVTGLLIFLRQRAILRREKILKEKDLAVRAANEARIEAELRAATAEKKRLQDEIDFKSREITTMAMNIVRKNELLETLDQELKQVRKTAKEGGEEKIKDISLMLAQTLSSEKERKEIELYIEEAQQNFFRNLEQQYPDLSIKERRLCGMIRQGLSSKEIAAVFNINTASVEVSRYRVRKKLGMEGSQDLQEFLVTV